MYIQYNTQYISNSLLMFSTLIHTNKYYSLNIYSELIHVAFLVIESLNAYFCLKFIHKIVNLIYFSQLLFSYNKTQTSIIFLTFLNIKWIFFLSIPIIKYKFFFVFYNLTLFSTGFSEN